MSSTDHNVRIHSLILRDAETGEELCQHDCPRHLDKEDEESCGEYCNNRFSSQSVQSSCLSDIFDLPLLFSVELPTKILDCEAVSREVTFHSKKAINNLKVVQHVLIQQNTSTREGAANSKWVCIEEWVFTFGFVIPGSTNTWQSIVVAAKDDKGGRVSSSRENMKGVEFIIETNFYDDNQFICKKSVRVRYV